MRTLRAITGPIRSFSEVPSGRRLTLLVRVVAVVGVLSVAAAGAAV